VHSQDEKARENRTSSRLTAGPIYDRNYVSRVTARDYPTYFMKNGISGALEVLELPLLAHAGPCFVALKKGVLVDECVCFGSIRERVS